MELNSLITSVNDAVWGYVLIFALVGCGVWFTIKTRFVQFRMVGEMIRLLTDSALDTVESQVKETIEGSNSSEPKRKHISSFQAFAVSVATRVGTGNLAGVASAIAIGGPGAVFWMWIIALIGSATAFVESTLAQLFKKKHKDSFIGGPAYYIQQGLKPIIPFRLTPSAGLCRRLSAFLPFGWELFWQLLGCLSFLAASSVLLMSVLSWCP